MFLIISIYILEAKEFVSHSLSATIYLQMFANNSRMFPSMVQSFVAKYHISIRPLVVNHDKLYNQYVMILIHVYLLVLPWPQQHHLVSYIYNSTSYHIVQNIDKFALRKLRNKILMKV